MRYPDLRYFLIVIFIQATSSHSQEYLQAFNSSQVQTPVGDNILNPASFSWSEHAVVSLKYSAHYFIPELGESTIGISRSTDQHGFALILNHSGDQRLQEFRSTAVYAQSFKDKFSLGLGLTRHQYSFSEGYGSKGFHYVNFGLLASINDEIRFGISVENAGRTSLLERFNERSPISIQSQLLYGLSDKCQLTAVLLKISDRKLSGAMAVIYQPLDRFCTRIFYQTLLNKTGITCGYTVKRSRVFITTIYQYPIGFTTSLSFSYDISVQK